MLRDGSCRLYDRLLRERWVELEFDTQERDQYGRLLAYVYVRGQMVNAPLVKEGCARVAAFPPTCDILICSTSWRGRPRQRSRGCGRTALSSDDNCCQVPQNPKICHQAEKTIL
jgi:endonuclease YncB( thermonuclease family)